MLQHAGELRDFAKQLALIKDVFGKGGPLAARAGGSGGGAGGGFGGVGGDAPQQGIEGLEKTLAQLQRQHEPLLIACNDMYERVRS